MNDSDRKYVSLWMEKADHDYQAAILIIEQNPAILDIACFHLQQAVEKYLKTFLVAKHQDFPRTHNLDILLQLCQDHSVAFLNLDLLNLEDFAVRIRYPDDTICPTFEEVQHFISLVQEVKEKVKLELEMID